MQDEPFYPSLWRRLRSSEPHVLMRLAISVACALVLLATGLSAAWAFAQASGNERVRDDHLAITMLAAGFGWCLALRALWSPCRSGRSLVAPAIGTIALAILVGLSAFVIDEMIRGRDSDFLIAAIVFAGFAALILIWLPAIHRRIRGRPVVGEDNRVMVQCPSCGYSMIGLYESRCPECGEQSTIDALIRAQNYGGVRTLPEEIASREPAHPVPSSVDAPCPKG